MSSTSIKSFCCFLVQLTTFFDRVGSDEQNGVSKSTQDHLLAKVNQNIEWVSENVESITSWLQDVNKRMIQLLPPANEMREGNVISSICPSFRLSVPSHEPIVHWPLLTRIRTPQPRIRTPQPCLPDLLNFFSLGDPLALNLPYQLILFKFVQYVAHTYIDKWAVGLRLKDIFCLFYIYSR